jgi:hypothetical protein
VQAHASADFFLEVFCSGKNYAQSIFGAVE